MLVGQAPPNAPTQGETAIPRLVTTAGVSIHLEAVAMGEIFIGACSWTDKTLIESGEFYPPKVRTPEARLRFYASRFPIVELGGTFESLPSRQVLEWWARCAPPGFLFHIRAFGLLVGSPMPAHRLPMEVRDGLPGGVRARPLLHLGDLPQTRQMGLWRLFREALQLLQGAGKLGLVIFRFSDSFLPCSESQAHILSCRTQLSQYKLAVEFRNNLWMGEGDRKRTLGLLRDNDLALVCVDEPQGFTSSVLPIGEVTSDQAYVRFHGRNKETWGKKGSAMWEQFNWDYTDAELQEWVPRLEMLREHAKATHVLFSTNYPDQSLANARRLAALLGLSGKRKP